MFVFIYLHSGETYLLHIELSVESPFPEQHDIIQVWPHHRNKFSLTPYHHLIIGSYTITLAERGVWGLDQGVGLLHGVGLT